MLKERRQEETRDKKKDHSLDNQTSYSVVTVEGAVVSPTKTRGEEGTHSGRS